MKKLPKFLIIAFGVIVITFQILLYLAKSDKAAQEVLVRSLPEKSLSISQEVFGPEFPPIELVKEFRIDQHFLVTEKHLDSPVRLRKFGERFCALEAKTHCYLLFYSEREAVPQFAGDLEDHVMVLAGASVG